MQKLFLTLTSLLFLFSSLFSASLSDKPTSSSLIVYNGGIGLVHEERELNLRRGDKQIIYRDVASTIETDSVNVALPESVTLFSQQYRFDKLTMSKLLDAHIGKRVQVAKESLTLLSHDGKSAIVRDKKDLISSVLSRDIIFETIPDSLITKPSLVWNIDAKKSLKTTMDINYLIKNLSWKSDYILNLYGNKADLTGWITIDNRSGKAYKETNLHVLAGDVNRVREQKVSRTYTKSMAVMDSAAPAVSHKAHEGYHFYSIPFKVNLANNEKTQIKFITEDAIPIERKYSTWVSNPLYLRSELKHSVSQFIEIKKLDFPLPKGVVRTYSKLDSKDVLLGESSLSHTAKDTPIKLTLGKNFDIKVKESIQNRSDDKRYYQASVKYGVKNSSDEKKVVEILVPFNKNTTSTIETTKKYKFKNGNQLSFQVVVDAKQNAEFLVKFRSKR